MWYNTQRCNIGASPSGKASDSDSDITGVRIPVPQPEKSTSVYRCAFFSYIRLRRVLLLRSDIRLTPSDIRFAREEAEHITSLCTAGAIHHCAQAQYHYGGAATSLFIDSPRHQNCGQIRSHTVGAFCERPQATTGRPYKSEFIYKSVDAKAFGIDFD